MPGKKRISIFPGPFFRAYVEKVVSKIRFFKTGIGKYGPVFGPVETPAGGFPYVLANALRKLFWTPTDRLTY